MEEVVPRVIEKIEFERRGITLSGFPQKEQNRKFFLLKNLLQLETLMQKVKLVVLENYEYDNWNI